MTVVAHSPTDVELDSYLTDGEHLFRVVDVLSGQALLLEDESGGELAWRDIEALEKTSLRLILPTGG